MSQFHSTLNRREFIKGFGAAGAGIAAFTAIAPAFRDIDEITSAGSTVQKLPWWVSEREYHDPTTPIDWQVIPRKEASPAMLRPRPTLTAKQRYDMGIPGGSAGTWATAEEAQVLYERMQREFPGWDPGYAGMGDNRTTALFMATKFMRMGNWPGEMNLSGKRVNISKAIAAAGGTGGYTGGFLGPRSDEILRPQDFNVPRWEGTPEENLQTLRSVVRFLGGSDVGAQELNDKTLKFFYAKSGAKNIVIKDVDSASETATEQIIPSKCKWIVTWTARQPYESTRRQAGEYEDHAVYSSYQRHPFAGAMLQEFAYALGYEMINPGNQSTPLAVLDGMGEAPRMCQPVLTPVYGTVHRAMWSMVTDLPLAPTKPIDFGGYKFCHTCGICAELCPFGCIEKGDPQWEANFQGTRPGYKGWRADLAKCPHCPICQGTCPFNTPGDGSFVHSVVKATVANTSAFNGFFSSMERQLGYGRKDPRDWWDIMDKPYGLDTSY